MARRMWLGVLSLVVAPAAGSGQEPVTGTVYLDADANGRRDPGEAGIAGVTVSNQHEVVATDAGGAYRLATRGTGLVFVSVPDGYRAAGRFWRAVPAGGGPVDLGLATAPRVESFTFIHGSDPHVQASNVGRLERAGAIADSVRPAFMLITGDLVRDALRVGEAEARSYFELYTRTVGAFAVPVWSAPGNHDVFGIERQSSLVSSEHPLYGRGMYRHYLGPDYYSFTYGGVHFIALNTVDYLDIEYYGHVDSTQVAWLEQDLARLPASQPVVTFNHIPFFTSVETIHGIMDGGPAPSVMRIDGRAQFRHSVANPRQLLALLWRHPYPIALGGHMHLRERIHHGIRDTTRFEQAAAITGGWVDGPIRAVSSVTVYRVERGKVSEGVEVAVP